MIRQATSEQVTSEPAVPEPAQRSPALPTVWGLSVRELHDAHWQGRGVQCVRCGEMQSLSRAAAPPMAFPPSRMTSSPSDQWPLGLRTSHTLPSERGRTVPTRSTTSTFVQRPSSHTQ